MIAPRLSVVIPVYNERFLVAELLRRVLALEISGISGIELIVVDDGSRDGTREILRELASREPRIRYFEHERNGGKGAALRTGIAAATGDLIVFQDADLEYDPRDYARLIKPFLEDGADVVYGSRFLPSDRRRVLNYRHSLGNRFLTALSNWFTDLDLTDMETCYKMFRAQLLKSIPIRSNDFAIEPEITAKVAKRQLRLFEVPISYLGRTYQEGKKIGWRDGLRALRAMVRFWLIDDLYAEDPYGSHMLHRIEKVSRFHRWMADQVRPHVGSRVVEIGAGLGEVTQLLMPRERYVAGDVNPNYLAYLRNLAYGRPYLEVERVDLEDGGSFAPFRGQMDTAICLSLLEDVTDPVAALRNLAAALEPAGTLILYVPQGPGLFSGLDETLGHRERYTREGLAAQLDAAGFELRECADFNRLAVFWWWLNGRVLGRRSFDRLPLKIFDLLVPLLRHLDRLLPWRGLGLLAVATKR